MADDLAASPTGGNQDDKTNSVSASAVGGAIVRSMPITAATGINAILEVMLPLIFRLRAPLVTGQLLLVQPGGVFWCALCLGPLLQDIPLHRVQLRKHCILIGVRAGEFDSMTTGIEEID